MNLLADPLSGARAHGGNLHEAVSRAALAHRFHGLVGEPPMAYSAQSRMALTAELHRSGDATLDAVARPVGYAHAFPWRAAFRRLNGPSPSQYRQQFGIDPEAFAGTSALASTGVRDGAP